MTYPWDRRKWVFAELGGGSFTRMDDGTWILEAAGEPTVSKFRQVPYSNFDGVDLVGIDPPGVRNRIFADHFETLTATGWQRVFNGCWLPAFEGIHMTREELRVAVVRRCDDFLAMPLWASAAQKATVAGLRKRVLEDDDFCDRWLSDIAPFLKEYSAVATKPMTAADAKRALDSIDWAALIAKYGPYLVAALQYFLGLLAGTTPMKAATCPDPNADPAACCQASVDASVHALAAALCCQACCCPTPPAPPPAA